MRPPLAQRDATLKHKEWWKRKATAAADGAICIVVDPHKIWQHLLQDWIAVQRHFRFKLGRIEEEPASRIHCMLRCAARCGDQLACAEQLRTMSQGVLDA